MINGPAHRRFGEIAYQWRGLVERRRDFYAELYRNGRWKIYFNEPDFVLRMREATALAKRWADLAPSAADAAPPSDLGSGRGRRNAA